MMHNSATPGQHTVTLIITSASIELPGCGKDQAIVSRTGAYIQRAASQLHGSRLWQTHAGRWPAHPSANALISSIWRCAWMYVHKSEVNASHLSSPSLHRQRQDVLDNIIIDCSCCGGDGEALLRSLSRVNCCVMHWQAGTTAWGRD
jgi:hypothetical protein